MSHITLLATTRNRRDDFRRLLESLRLQTFHNFTLLLGDQNQANYLADILAEFEHDFSIIRIQLSPTDISSARNSLVRYIPSNCNIVALTDDDCHYAPDALANVATAFEENSRLVALIGNANGRSTKKSMPAGRFDVFHSAPSWVLFFRTDAFLANGSFDTSMGIGSHTPWQSGEETDFLLRIMSLTHMGGGYGGRQK